jgi:hypothetical protein
VGARPFWGRAFSRFELCVIVYTFRPKPHYYGYVPIFHLQSGRSRPETWMEKAKQFWTIGIGAAEYYEKPTED